MVLADIGGAIIVAAAIVTIVVGVVTLAPGGRKLIAGIWARFSASRREREVLRRQLTEMAEQIELLQERVTGLEVTIGRWPTSGMMFDQSPEAKRIKQAAKDHDKK